VGGVSVEARTLEHPGQVGGFGCAVPAVGNSGDVKDGGDPG
jgi:hypothetical protein